MDREQVHMILREAGLTHRQAAEAIDAVLALAAPAVQEPTMPRSIVNAFFGKEREAWEHGFKTGCRMMQERSTPATQSAHPCCICKGDPERCDVHDCGDMHREPAAQSADAVDAMERAVVLLGNTSLPKASRKRAISVLEDAIAALSQSAAAAKEAT